MLRKLKMSEHILKLQNCQKKFDVEVLKGLNLAIERGEFISIMGSSGSGKTTLLNILMTIEELDGGDYYYNNLPIKKYKSHELRLHEFGFIFQNYHLLENHTLRENILLPYVYLNKKCVDEEYFEELITKLDLKKLLGKKVLTLSGGEKQRVAIARSLILNPQIIFADEPTGNLDEKNALIILEMLQKLNDEGKTIVLITHSFEAADFAKTKYALKEGSLHER